MKVIDSIPLYQHSTANVSPEPYVAAPTNFDTSAGVDSL